MLEELYEQYGQFLIMALVFLVGFAVYYGYTYYKNQEDVKKVNNNIKLEVKEKPEQQQQQQQQQASKQPKQLPVFVPSEEFKGQQPGYTFKNGEKGQGYYMDK